MVEAADGVRLLQKDRSVLIDITLQGLNRVFLCDTGSVAVAETMQDRDYPVFPATATISREEP